nr:MAG TPA: hypothetical protein [Caudoviricetes sp.]
MAIYEPMSIMLYIVLTDANIQSLIKTTKWTRR